MTQYDPPPVQMSYGTPPAPPEPQGPGPLLMTMGIISIVYGTLMMCCIGVAFIGVFTPQPPGSPVQMTAWDYIVPFIQAINVPLLIASGIGSIMVKGWSRWLAYAFAIITLIIIPLNFLFAGGLDTSQLTPEAARGYEIGRYIGVCGFAIYPIVLLIVYSLPAVTQRLDRRPSSI